MPVSPARSAAFDILLRVEREDSYSSELLHSPQYQKLSPQNHRLATELVMGVLRWRSSLDHQITQASDRSLQKLDAEVLTALRLAAYQLLFLDRVPARAAVNESVELVRRSRKRSAMPFANAVLRKLSSAVASDKRKSQTLDGEDPSSIADCFAHPQWMVERWQKNFGREISSQICAHDQQVPQASIRFHGASAETLEAELGREGVTLAPGKLLASARRVQAGDLTNTSAFRRGSISIQDEASQLVAMLVGNGATILDCCAAPGGKTRILAEHNPEATVVAMELHPHRARLLRRMVAARNVKVVAADALHPPSNALFDRLLVDAPCSGTGTLARNPEIKWRLTPQDIADLKAKQTAILQSAMKHVAQGGRLIYSTCSLEPEENSAVVETAQLADDSFHVVNCGEILHQLQTQGELAWKDSGSLIKGKYLRTIPGLHPCDGFFAAVLERD